MATLEDKILGEKLEYYCSSSESDNENDEQDNEHEVVAEYGKERSTLSSTNITGSSTNRSDNRLRSGCSNTGPKGVIKDWQRYKQLQTEQREEQNTEREKLIKKLSLTCRPDSVVEEERKHELELEELLEEGDDEVAFMRHYAMQRMAEMLQQVQKKATKVFGSVVQLQTRDEYLHAIDDEAESVTVAVHIFEDTNATCRRMHHCLKELASVYPDVKFCEISASIAGMSWHFKTTAVPALLVYKGGNLLRNLIQLGNELGEDDFTANDVDSLLIENGVSLSNQKIDTT